MNKIKSCTRKHKKRFNLVEVTLAMGVLAFGMTGVFSMTMAGMKNARDTIGDTYAIMLAEYMFGSIQANSGSSRFFQTGDKSDLITVYDAAGASTSDIIIEEQAIDKLENTVSNSEMRAEKLNDQDKGYDFEILNGGSSSKSGAWRCRVRAKNVSTTGEVTRPKKGDAKVDFTADVRVWLAGHGTYGSGAGTSYMYPYMDQSGIPNFRKDVLFWDWYARSDRATKGLSYDASPHSHAGIFVEVTWPTDRDLLSKNGKIQRNRRVFYREIYK